MYKKKLVMIFSPPLLFLYRQLISLQNQLLFFPLTVNPFHLPPRPFRPPPPPPPPSTLLLPQIPLIRIPSNTLHFLLTPFVRYVPHLSRSRWKEKVKNWFAAVLPAMSYPAPPRPTPSRFRCHSHSRPVYSLSLSLYLLFIAVTYS